LRLNTATLCLLLSVTLTLVCTNTISPSTKPKQLFIAPTISASTRHIHSLTLYPMMASAYAAFRLALTNSVLVTLEPTVKKLLMLKRPSHVFTAPCISPKLVAEASYLSTFYVFVSEAVTLGPCALYHPFSQAV
jgi:hypothetical protein